MPRLTPRATAPSPPAVALLFAAALGLAPAAAARAADLTPAGLIARLKTPPAGADADALAADLRAWFGGAEKLAAGPNPKVDGTAVAWAVEAAGAKSPPALVSEDGVFHADLAKVGTTDVYALAVAMPDGFATRWAFEVEGKRLPHPAPRNGGGNNPPFAQLEVYGESAESRPDPDAPRGTLLAQPPFKSEVFRGTTRDWWVYVPKQAADAPEAPAAVMVFQDGAGYREFVPTVFDRLIAAKAMPVTVGVFVNPGTLEGGRSNRSFEYDTLSDQYARFLLEELLPAAEAAAKVKLRKDAAGRATAGISSGGICAWTAAWERPGEFSKVLSWVGSFTNIASGPSRDAGGHNYEALVRKTPKKPIRVFLQDGANDLDNANGNWPLANQQMARSLAFAGYDHKFVYGLGFHSNRHGRAVLPESLRWLWRGWESEVPK